jgi:oligosaccharide repeat unit polymerase
VLLIYFIGGIGSLFFYKMQSSDSIISLGAIIYHILMLLLLILPLQNFDKYAYSKTEIIPEIKLRPFVYILVIISIISIFDSIQYISFDNILNDIVGVRQSQVEINPLQGTLLGYVTYYARIYWSIALILMFYYLAYYPSKKIIILLLFISSLSQVIESFTIAGRDIVLKYIFIFIILILFFRFKLPKKVKKNIYTLFIIIVCSFASFFVLISLLRWDLNSTAKISTSESLLSYLGQPLLYFSGFFQNFATDGATGGSIHFPLFAYGDITSRHNLNNEVMANIQLNTFATSIGTWVFELGALLASIIAIIHSILIYHLKRKKNTIFTIIYIVWVFEFIFFSYFYYVYTINLGFIASILFVKILEILYNYFYFKRNI